MYRLVVACLLLLTVACSNEPKTASKGPDMTPPMAAKKPKKLEKHGHVRTDDYFWLKERENPEVIKYLEDENEYTAAAMAHVKPFEDQLFEEIKSRINQVDKSVPYKLDGYWYYTRNEEGKQYRIYCRKKGSLEGAEEVMLDANQMAEGHSYFAVSARRVSSNGELLAYATDTRGRRIYSISFKNLISGETLSDTLPDVTSNIAWANDNKTLFYTRQDPKTLRRYQIYRHTLGTEAAKDVLVYEEKDDTFSTFVFRTKSKKYLMIASRHTLATEYRYLDADKPSGEFTVFLPRERDHEYSLDHYGDKFYVRTNRGAANFRLAATPVNQTGESHWKEIIPHRDDVYLSGFDIFKDHLVARERKNGLAQVRIIRWDGSEEHYLNFGEPAYSARPTTNLDFDTNVMRYNYTSLTTPSSTYDYDMNSKEKTLLKQEEVLGGFDQSKYKTERLLAPARDGVAVPISIVYRKDLFGKGTNPVLVYGYGSYGSTLDPRFSSANLSLLDRGFVYALAHVRGGQINGRKWYEDGKLLKKKNTFTDFIDCTRYLIEKQYADSGKVFAMGGSAGGLLMGAVYNMEPTMFKGIIASVPFVDVMTTMLDDTIPLTTGEYDEWGDPNKKEYYDYMLSYSPYDNVQAKDYTNMLVTTGLHDSQVQYWEPAKWVAKLRAMKTDSNRLLLKTNMDAGHGGASGRFERYRDVAFRFSFILDLAGISK